MGDPPFPRVDEQALELVVEADPERPGEQGTARPRQDDELRLAERRRPARGEPLGIARGLVGRQLRADVER